MYINPCSQNDVNGRNFTIPAQQFNVATLANLTGGPAALLYFGERFRSSSTSEKSSDYQYWGQLFFDPVTSALLPLQWQDNFTLVL
jgi:hypothetical protein